MSEPASPQPLIRKHMPELDSIRGIAIIMVVMYHGFFYSTYLHDYHLGNLTKHLVALTQGGWLGVQLFFVLSGFLITGILVDTKPQQNYFKSFYKKRALRILPAYLALLFILLILGFIGWPFLIASLLFLSNLAFLLGIPLQYGLLWTLAIEEQFYLIWPQLAYRLSSKALLVLSITIVIATPLLRLLTFLHGSSDALFFATWLNADGLALGATLALVCRLQIARRRIFYVAIAIATVSIAITLIGAPYGIFAHNTLIGASLRLATWQLLCGAGILLSLFIGAGKWKQWILPSWLRYVGKISYGLYLIHWLIFMLLDQLFNFSSPLALLFRFVIAIALSVIIASLSRNYFEEFFLRIGRNSTT